MLFSKPRARAKFHEYTFRFTPLYSHFSSLALTHNSFLFSFARTGAKLHFYYNPLNLAPTSTFLLVRYTHSHLTTSHLASAFAFLFSRLAPQTTRLRLKHLNKPEARRPAVVSLCFAPCCEYCLDSIRGLLGLLVLSTFVCLCLPSQTTVFTTIQTNNLNILKALGLTTPKHHNVPEHH
jgi:hypothetical protein